MSGNPKKPKQEIVTGSFNLHFEDVVKSRHMPLVILAGAAIIAIGAALPVSIFRTLASPNDTKPVDSNTITVPPPDSQNCPAGTTRQIDTAAGTTECKPADQPCSNENC